MIKYHCDHCKAEVDKSAHCVLSFQLPNGRTEETILGRVITQYREQYILCGTCFIAIRSLFKKTEPKDIDSIS